MSKVLLSAATAATFVLASSAADAIPAFARQTGNDCSTCHSQHYPTLNEVGRDFKAGGYTDMGKGKQEKIEKDDISLPGILNTSLFLKLRYQKTNGIELPGERTTNSGEWAAPHLELAEVHLGKLGAPIFTMRTRLSMPATAPEG